MFKELDKYKIYTREELFQLSSEYEEAKEFINESNGRYSLFTIIKPIIKNYEEFDEHTKYIYQSIAQKIKEINPDQNDLYVLAVGSRVKGKWRSDEETENIAKLYNIKKLKYSDYDFCTNAKNIPDLKNLANELNVRLIDRMGSSNEIDGVKIPLI